MKSIGVFIFLFKKIIDYEKIDIIYHTPYFLIEYFEVIVFETS